MSGTAGLKALAHKVLERDTRRDRERDSAVPLGASGPTRAGHTPAPRATSLSVPSEWTKAFVLLLALPCPHRVDRDRWSEVLADAKDLMGRWAPMLAAMKWTATEAFGVDPQGPVDRPDHMSLLWLMRGQRISAVTTNAVILRGPNYETTCIYRRSD